MRAFRVALCSSLLVGTLGCSSSLQLLSVTAISPETLGSGSSATTLTVTGTQFNSRMSVILGSAVMPTTFVSGTTLTTTVPAGIAVGSYPIAILDNEGGLAGAATLQTSFSLQVSPLSK